MIEMQHQENYFTVAQNLSSKNLRLPHQDIFWSENQSIVGGWRASLRAKLGFTNLGRLRMMTRTLRMRRELARAMAGQIRAQSPCRQRGVVGGRGSPGCGPANGQWSIMGTWLQAMAAEAGSRVAWH